MRRAKSIAVRICGSESSTDSERRLEKIVEFFGIHCRTLEPDQVSSMRQPGDDGASSRYSVLLSASQLTYLLKKNSFAEFPPLLNEADSLFVFGFDESAESTQLLRWLTRLPTADLGVRRPSSRRVSVSKESPELCGPLSGVTVQCSTSDDCRGFFGVRQCKGFRSLMASGDADLFFECRARHVPVFLSASSVSVDLDLPVVGSFFDVRDCFGGVAPLVTFLKHAFSDGLWSMKEINASLIVDDPALKRRYGFLDFEAALTSMEQNDFCTTIAFIPWNWRRTHPRTADIFVNNPDRYSLVVHGCDHTAREFGTPSVPILNQKVKGAQQRIERHLRKTGVHVSPIMVFPQGVFSSEAAHVLKSNNFIAAVNTDVNPVGDGQRNTEVRELWNLAIMKYSSFAIFTRRYLSHGLENFAFDAFLGKPCLLVGHHELFKNDARELRSFVESLNSLNGGVRWGGLANVLKRSYHSRENGDGTQSVRMCANEMILEGPLKDPGTILVEKEERDLTAIKAVTCNQQEVDWTWQGRHLRFRVTVPSQRTVVVRIEYFDSLGEAASRESTKQTIKVLARRYLSELRDDYINRSGLLTTFADRCARLMRRR